MPCIPFHDPLLPSLASRAAPDAALPDFSSRQAVTLLWSFTRLKMTAILPTGRLDEWISAVRVAHEATPLLAADARNLERCLEALGMDSSWVQVCACAGHIHAHGLLLGACMRMHTCM